MISDAYVNEFKSTMEIHLGGCGIIELSTDWAEKTKQPLDAGAAALAFPFGMCYRQHYNPCMPMNVLIFSNLE